MGLVGSEVQLLDVVLWVATLTFLRLSLQPYLERTFTTLGAPLSYSVSILLFTGFSWYLGWLGIPVVFSMLPFTMIFVWYLSRGAYTYPHLKACLRWDAVFAFGFLSALMVRFVNPSISFAEKFMDHAFLASVMRSPVVPPLDPWYAGGTLKVYYYLGYWMFGSLGVLTGIPSTVLFNLVLPTVFGLTLVNAVLVGHLLLPRFRWVPAAVFFLVNPSFLLLLLQGEGISTVLWESTRTISNTITEFPLFSIIWGDVHPHVMGLFNQVFLIALLLIATQQWHSMGGKARLTLITLCALSLGTMPPLNSWDVLLYAPIMLLFGVLIWHRSRAVQGTTNRVHPLTFLLLVPLLGVALYFPYYLDLTTAGIKGIGIVYTPSDPIQFLLVHGWFLVILTAACIPDIRRRPFLLLVPIPLIAFGYTAVALATIPLVYLCTSPAFRGERILAILGLIALIIPEFIFLKDSFGDPYYRMNTVFKFSYAAWVLLGLSASVIVARWMTPRLPAVTSSRSLTIASAVCAILVILSPLVLGPQFGVPGGTLDGMEYLASSHPADARALTFLRSLEGEEIIVEAEGGDYGYFSRVSSFTGIPTIIGWPYHEITWRGDGHDVMTRVVDVQSIYEDPSQTMALLQKYNATLLYVGDTEREHYRVNLPSEGLAPLFTTDGTIVYRVVMNASLGPVPEAIV